MIFDWPEVTSRLASQLAALIRRVLSLLLATRALPAPTFVIIALDDELPSLCSTGRVDDARER